MFYAQTPYKQGVFIMPYLTDVERCVVDYIIYFNRRFNRSPILIEIAGYHEMSIAGIVPAMKALVGYGYINWKPGKRIELTMHKVKKAG